MPTSAHPRRPRRAALISAVTGAAVLAGGLLAEPGAAIAADDDLASRFTLAVLPDTQFYSRYSPGQFETRYGTDPFQEQTRWLAANAEDLEIPFVAHLGDVVDQVGQEPEWVAADRALRVLEDADVPYSVLPGNHDVRDSNDDLDDTAYDLADEPYLRWFGADRAAEQATFGGADPTGLSQYHIFEAEGQRFMVLALPWRASDATFAWADAAMAAHPDVPVVLTTHQLIDIAEDGVTAEETDYGLEVWDKLIRDNDQIFLTLNGHFHGTARQTKLNDAGHEVTQLVIDHQMAYEGGNGYLSLLEFDLTNNRISTLSPSPWVVQKPEELLTSFDQPFLTGPNDEFTIELDFAERFASFAPGFSRGEPASPSLIGRARATVLDGFTPPPAPDTAPPAATTDYPEVDGTLAHWRFNGLDGVLEPGESVPDIAGDADLTRVSIGESGSPTAQPGDVTVIGESEPYSSDGAAMCFTNSSRSENRFSYLTTAPDASVNDAALEGGYTIETFLRIDESWTEPENAWMKAIVRSGNRSTIGVPETRWDWTASPVALGLSNLREFQWTEVPIDTAKGDRTNWSGEIMVDKWTHVAIVNDPATAITTMYVDGAPTLRTASDTVGHGLNENMPWLFGSDWVDDRATNGWNGCIGETRVVDHPLAADEWLTARADLSDVTVDAAPASGPVSAVTGTGVDGATITLSGDLHGTAVVGEDGLWSVTLDAPLAAGRYAVEVRQAFGDRVGDAVTAELVFPAPIASRIAASPSRYLVTGSRAASYSGVVRSGAAGGTGTVEVRVDGRLVATTAVDGSDSGRFSVPLTGLRPGLHRLTASFISDAGAGPARSGRSWVLVR